ncbi:Iron-sulfur cluster assembly 1-like protein, mitochondrial [Smittium culicis]|uniref:Iron-sulfur assembly protein 1 n=1 Tax=Smittium culicis TaxID=133412 RepID=A0A1R1Y1G7_9FUNG|nr:Iron-sulfur cluster assembly 1-like protein, mitochondrial [Smittium culicis]OMJ20801.1 Iron-sulfur cluster assembly 1-like protein, mitochondrial [Smittium culicis]
MSARISVRLAKGLKPTKKILTMTPNAVSHLKGLHEKFSIQNDEKFLKIGIQGKGCSGSAYTMNWVDKPNKFDEKVVQDGVTVFIDSKALLSLIGTEMDYFSGKLASQFVFNNPNIKGACGCGESFMV